MSLKAKSLEIEFTLHSVGGQIGGETMATKTGLQNNAFDQWTDLARRMIQARKDVADMLPVGFINEAPLDLMLNLYVDGPVIATDDLVRCTTTSRSITMRWLDALVAVQVVETVTNGWALTDLGRKRVLDSLKRIVAKRAPLRSI